MRRLVATVMVLGAIAALPGRADAQSAPGGQSAAGQSAAPAIPANGVEPELRRGFYAEAALGVFTALGGDAGVSNGQPFLSMTFGHTLGDDWAIFASLGIGANSSNCYDDGVAGNCNGADSFAATFYELGGSYAFELTNRLHLTVKLVSGLTQFSPSPIHDAGSNPITVSGSLIGFHFGTGVGLDYETHLDHFSVGIELTGRYSIASVSLASIDLIPRVRYVF